MPFLHAFLQFNSDSSSLQIYFNSYLNKNVELSKYCYFISVVIYFIHVVSPN